MEVACAIFQCQWFKVNEMKANADKCYVLLNTSNELTVKINEVQIKNSQWEKLLGITIDNDLKFEDHIGKLETCCMPLQAFQTLHPASRLCVVGVVLTFIFYTY